METRKSHPNSAGTGLHRRSLLTRLASGVLLWTTGTAALADRLNYEPGAFAEELARTPRLTEGPFYPDKMPLDTELLRPWGRSPISADGFWMRKAIQRGVEG